MINWGYAIAGSLFFLGISFFFYFASRKKYRDPTAAPNYEKVRNKLTTREPEVEEEEEYDGSGFGAGMLGNLIGGFIVILVGFSLIGPIASQVNSALNYSCSSSTTYVNGVLIKSASDCSNVTMLESSKWASTILQLVPGFFCVGLIAVAITILYTSFRKGGML